MIFRYHRLAEQSAICTTQTTLTPALAHPMAEGDYCLPLWNIP